MIEPILIADASDVPRVGRIITLPMVPHQITRETLIGGQKFLPGWYGVYVDNRADCYISAGFIRSERKREIQLLCMAWNVGQLGLTKKQCSNIMGLWGQPVLEPSMFNQIRDNELMTEAGRALLDDRDFRGYPNSFRTVEEALLSVNQASHSSL